MTVPTDPFLFVNGVTADAAQVNARYAPLYATLAGGVDMTNLAPSLQNAFPKLLVAADLKIAFGQVPPFTWADSQPTTVVTVTHGLGRLPLFAIASNGSFGGTDPRLPFITAIADLTTTNMRMSLSSNNGGTFGAFPVTGQLPYWLVMG